jgi:hypothetical protein
MLTSDKKKLKELLEQYSVQELVYGLSEVVLDEASNMAVRGLCEKAKRLTHASVILEYSATQV